MPQICCFITELHIKIFFYNIYLYKIYFFNFFSITLFKLPATFVYSHWHQSLFALVSGRPAPLGLPAAEEHAGEDTHAGPEGGDAGDALRELQGRVYPQDDADGCAGEETQVGGAHGVSEDQAAHTSKCNLSVGVCVATFQSAGEAPRRSGGWYPSATGRHRLREGEANLWEGWRGETPFLMRLLCEAAASPCRHRVNRHRHREGLQTPRSNAGIQPYAIVSFSIHIHTCRAASSAMNTDMLSSIPKFREGQIKSSVTRIFLYFRSTIYR